MKKIAILMAAGATVLVSVAPVQAATQSAADPVRALQAKLKPGRGVYFVEKVSWSDGTDAREYGGNKGVFQFGRKGLSGYDITMEGGQEPERVIGIGRTVYRSGGVLSIVLKDKKKPWYKTTTGGGYPGGAAQIINAAEPKTLAALLRKGKRDKNSVTGTITVGDLKKVSPWVARIRNQDNGVKVGYTLWLTSGGLVSRLRSTWTTTENSETDAVTVDSRYTKWGSKVSIKAPAPSKVTTKLF